MKLIQLIKKNNFLILLTLLGLILLLPNLGDRTFFGDESYTMIVSKTVAEEGYPASYYNGFFINAKETANADIFGKQVYTWNSWSQFYITALFYKIFGMNEFFLRLPFVLFGLATLILLYFFAKEITNNEMIARISSIFLALSTTFILHARQLRWYSMSAFLVLAILYSYWVFLKDKRIFWFAFSSIFLFHTNTLIFFVTMLSVTLHFLVFKFNKGHVKKAILSLISIFLFTFPWFVITNQFSKLSGTTSSIFKIVFHMVLNWFYLFILLFPIIFLIAFLFKRFRKELLKEGYLLVIFFIISFITILSLKSDVLPAVRYLICLIPLTSIILSFTIVKIWQNNKTIAVIIALLLVLTNLLNLVPFILLKGAAGSLSADVSDYNKEKFIKDSLGVKFYLPSYLYEITNDYESSEELVINQLLEKGSEKDTFTTSHFPYTFIIYTDMEYIPVEEIKEGPDWIIKRSFRIGEDEVEEFFNKISDKLDLSDYELIKISNFDERWADSPDPISHRFKTNLNGEVLVYHLEND